MLVNRVLHEDLQRRLYVLAHDDHGQPLALLDDEKFGPHVEALFEVARDLFHAVVAIEEPPPWPITWSDSWAALDVGPWLTNQLGPLDSRWPANPTEAGATPGTVTSGARPSRSKS